jgi:hypothetical protein
MIYNVVTMASTTRLSLELAGGYKRQHQAMAPPAGQLLQDAQEGDFPQGI